MASQNQPRTGRSVDELVSALFSSAPDDDATRRNALDEICSRLSAVHDTNDRGPPERRRRLLAGAASADAPVPFDGADLGRLAEAVLRYAGDEEKPAPRALLDEARASSRAAASCLVAARPRPATRAAARRETPRAREREKRRRSPSPSSDTLEPWYAALLGLSEIVDETDALRDDRASVRVSPDDARARLAKSRRGLSKEAVCANATCIKNFEEVTSSRRALERVRDDVAPGINMRLPRISSLEDVCETDQIDAAHYGTEEGDHDYVQQDHGCITFKNELVWRMARDGGTISNHYYELLSREGAAQTLNDKPLAMPVTVGGTRPKPNKTFLGLCECVR